MTKIVTLVYYHSMARFFCAIEDAWKQFEPDAQFLHLAVFPSAWAYFTTHRRQVVSLSWRSHVGSRQDTHVPDEELDALIRFHAADPNLTRERDEGLRRQARKMIGVCHAIVNEFDPDIAIVSGDTRLPAEALMRALNGSKAVSWYFEQGPYRTTVMDRQGVNANCSFRRELAHLKPSGAPFKPPANPGRWSNRLYTLIDRLVLAQGNVTGFVPPDLLPYRLRMCARAHYANLSSRTTTRSDARNTVLIAMQVPEDANNVYHNPLNLDDVGLLRMVLESIQPGWTVVVREHPLYRRKYSPAFYALIATSRNVVLSKASLQDDLKRTRTTVTVNSLTGLDAFAQEHCVIVLGESFYDHIPGVRIARSKSDLSALLAGPDEPLPYKPAVLLGPLIEKFFFNGHFTDMDLSFTAKIARRIAASAPAS